MNESQVDSIPFTLIRGGTSRGVYFREGDLPAPGPDRDRLILRAFRGDGGTLADGLGGENPTLRKVAIVSPAHDADGTPVLHYAFAQVSSSLERLDRTAECGNISSGVPLFAALSDWTVQPHAGGRVRMLLTNSGTRVDVEWLTVSQAGGMVRLGFWLPEDTGDHSILPLGEPCSSHDEVRFSVVRGLNTYLIVRSEDLGIPDPLGIHEVSEDTYRRLDALVDHVTGRLGPGVIKVCLATSDTSVPDRMRARMLYPSERRLHPSFAVTGATTLALASTVRGSVLERPPSQGRPYGLSLDHPSGSIDLECTPDGEGRLLTVALSRSCRLIARGTLY